MKAKHHFWSSLAAGGALYLATGAGEALAGAMIGGFLIDADHALDQLWAVHRGAPHMKRPAAQDVDSNPVGVRRCVHHYMRRRKLVRLPLVFHSLELLIALSIITVFFPAPFLIGMVTGQALHLLLDFTRHYHEFRSPLFYLLSYRLIHRFKRDRLIKPEFL